MFTIDRLVEDCRAALDEEVPALAVRDVLAKAVADPATARTFDPDRSALEVLHSSDDLTVLHVGLAPHVGSNPHEHRMWAVVGILDGQEDNAFFRRGDDALVPSGGRELQQGDVLVMGDDTIHAIRNPRTSYLSALHVYGGDLMGCDRTEWDPGGRDARPYDEARIQGMIAALHAEEERLGRGLSGDEIDALLAALRATSVTGRAAAPQGP